MDTTTLSAQLLASLKGGEGAPDVRAAPGLVDALLQRLVQAMMMEGPQGGPRTDDIHAALATLRRDMPNDLPEPEPREQALHTLYGMLRVWDLSQDLVIVGEQVRALREDAPRADALRRLAELGESPVSPLCREGEDPRELEILLLKLSAEGLVHSALRKGNLWWYTPTEAGRVALELLGR